MKLDSLSPEQRRVMLATAAGWKSIRALGLDEELHGWIEPGPLEPLPDYDESLDACADLEAKLTDEQHHVFRRQLQKLCGDDGVSYDFREYVSASAIQRCSALLLTLCPEVEL
jgi:hypothetical protein